MESPVEIIIDSFFESCINDMTWSTGVERLIEKIFFIFLSTFTGKSLSIENINIILFGAFIIKLEYSIFKLLLY